MDPKYGSKSILLLIVDLFMITSSSIIGVGH